VNQSQGFGTSIRRSGAPDLSAPMRADRRVQQPIAERAMPVRRVVCSERSGSWDYERMLGGWSTQILDVSWANLGSADRPGGTEGLNGLIVVESVGT
jgi:hypothetical protein